MTGALSNQNGRVGKTTPLSHHASVWAAQEQRDLVVVADPQGSALDWPAERTKEAEPTLFSGAGLARDLLHRDAPEHAHDVDHLVIGGPTRIAVLPRSALLVAGLVLVLTQSPPFDRRELGKALDRIGEVRIIRPHLAAGLIVHRCAARDAAAEATAIDFTGSERPILTWYIRQHAASASAARIHRPVSSFASRPRGRIKLTARCRGLIAANMLHALPQRPSPDSGEGTP